MVFAYDGALELKKKEGAGEYMGGKRIAKGQYGYIRQQKIWASIRTFFLYALSLSFFGIGIGMTGTKENLLTVVAILGCLPAGRSTVNMVMFLRAEGCSREAKEKIGGCAGEFTELFDMFFTSYEKNYQISHMVVKDHIVCGYSESRKMDIQACEKHLSAYLKQGGCKGAVVKIYDDMEKYCEGLRNLGTKEKAVSSEGENKNSELGILEVSLMHISEPTRHLRRSDGGVGM